MQLAKVSLKGPRVQSTLLAFFPHHHHQVCARMPPKSSSSSSSSPRILYWFRTDLRLHDSPALAKALDLSPKAFFPVFNFDPHYAYDQRVGARRFRFLLESMQDLSNEIRKLNSNSQLLVTRGDPQRRIKELCEKWQVTHVAFEEDHNDYGRSRDAEVRKSLEKAGIEIVSCEGHHLYPIMEVLKKNGNKPPTSMGAYQKAISSLGDVPKPTPTPKSLPDPLAPGADKVDLKKLHQLVDDLAPLNKDPGPPEVDINSGANGGQRHGDVTLYDTVAEHEKDPFAVPTLSSLGMEEPEDKLCKAIRGGSSVALKRLDDLCKDPSYLATFAKPQTSPSTDPDKPSTTLLSPYIKFGCLGIRHFWHQMKETKSKHKGNKTDVPEGMEGQLLFRDMYAACEAAIGDAFHGVRGNSMAKFFDWYLPDVYDDKGNKIVPRPKGDEESEKRLAAWESGTTGFPWIDANMRMLRQCGWMHHLGRHSVAAYLTRAQCFISWERGAEVFAKYLLDWCVPAAVRASRTPTLTSSLARAPTGTPPPTQATGCGSQPQPSFPNSSASTAWPPSRPSTTRMATSYANSAPSSRTCPTSTSTRRTSCRTLSRRRQTVSLDETTRRRSWMRRRRSSTALIGWGMGISKRSWVMQRRCWMARRMTSSERVTVSLTRPCTRRVGKTRRCEWAARRHAQEASVLTRSCLRPRRPDWAKAPEAKAALEDTKGDGDGDGEMEPHEADHHDHEEDGEDAEQDGDEGEEQSKGKASGSKRKGNDDDGKAQKKSKK